jgi:poly(3-hydroxybutyrate) depolymerase
MRYLFGFACVCTLGVAPLGCDDAGASGSSVNASTGCDVGSLDSSVTHVDISFGGRSRSYELHVPAGYDGSTPTSFVLNFHGVTSTGEAQRLFSEMDAVADGRGFIVAYPNGIENSWNAGLCCGAAVSEGIDDVGFARAVIDDLGERGCIDLNRVYATGMSKRCPSLPPACMRGDGRDRGDRPCRGRDLDL